MAYEGWICYGGVELVNSARTAAYSHAYGMNVRYTGGPWLQESLGDAPYTSPDQDEAPWFDPGTPESKHFLGLAGLEILGAGAGTGTTGWVDLLDDGAIPGPLRRGPRELQVRALAVAGDDAALSYGLAWLASALRGDQCAGGGDELMLYAASPAPLPDPSDPCGPLQTAGWDAVERGNQLQRQLFRVALLEAPRPEPRRSVGGGVVAEVRFTLRAGVPYWHRAPVVVASKTTTPPDEPDTYRSTHVGVDLDAVWDECERIQSSEYCLTDPRADEVAPDCTDPTPPPQIVTPIDPCYPGDYSSTVATRFIIRTRGGLTPNWLETVPVVTLSPGTQAMRKVTIRWWSNPIALPAHPDNLDPCALCSGSSVAYLPAGSTLTLDGRTRQAVVMCDGARYAEPTLYGPRGEMFTWPEWDCGTSMFFELILGVIDGDVWGINDDWDYSVSMVAREDAC